MATGIEEPTKEIASLPRHQRLTLVRLLLITTPAARRLPASELEVLPYYIPYIVRDPVIWILAVAHGHRRPDYWMIDAGNIHKSPPDS